MPWPRDESDPLRAKRRELAEQERLLAAQMSKLTDELRDGPEAAARKAAEPPIWRMEDEGRGAHAPEMSPAKRRDLARQRRQDKILFFLFIALLLLVTGVFIWVYETHLRGPQ